RFDARRSVSRDDLLGKARPMAQPAFNDVYIVCLVEFGASSIQRDHAARAKDQLARHVEPDDPFMPRELYELPLRNFKGVIRCEIGLDEDIALQCARPRHTISPGSAGALYERAALTRVPALYRNFNIARKSQRPLQSDIDNVLRTQRYGQVARL